MPDLTSRIRFGPVFPKTSRIIVCRTDPDSIWMAWSGLGEKDLVRKQAGVQESAGLRLSNASELIRIGCEWGPACLLGTCQWDAVPSIPQCYSCRPIKVKTDPRTNIFSWRRKKEEKKKEEETTTETWEMGQRGRLLNLENIYISGIIQTHKTFKRTVLIRTKHNMRIFGVINPLYRIFTTALNLLSECILFWNASNHSSLRFL